MNDFTKRGGKRGFGGAGRPSFGGPRFNKPGFGKKRWDNEGGERSTERFDATCSSCGKECDVPFRPVNGKPVYCRDCFSKTNDRSGATERFPKRDFNSRGPRNDFDRPRFDTPKREDNTAVIRQIEALNTKLDALISAVAALSPSKPIPASETTKVITKEKVTKKAAKTVKKAVAKKKKTK